MTTGQEFMLIENKLRAIAGPNPTRGHLGVKDELHFGAQSSCLFVCFVCLSIVYMSVCL